MAHIGNAALIAIKFVAALELSLASGAAGLHVIGGIREGKFELQRPGNGSTVSGAITLDLSPFNQTIQIQLC